MEKNKKVSKIIDILLNILIVFFAVILFFSLYMGFQIKVLKNDYANFFGYTFFETQTGSMKDTINPGDWIVVKITKDVKTGDIVTYKLDNSYITHRIVEMYKGTYITKGDNNPSKDGPVDESQIIGKVTKVLPTFGIIRKTIFNKKIILLLIVVLFLINIFMKDDKDNAAYEAKIKIFLKRTWNKLFKGTEEKKDKKEVKKEMSVKEIKKEPKVEIKEDKKTEEVKIKKEEEKEEPEEDIDDDLSKTQVLRIISMDCKIVEPEVKEEEKDDNEEIEIVKQELTEEEKH